MFGKSEKYGIVVAWYCKEEASLDSESKAKENIGQKCIPKGKKYNKCAIDKAVKFMNAKRKEHQAPDLAKGEDTDADAL